MTTSTTDRTLSQQLASHFHAFEYAHVGVENISTAKALLLDYLGVSLRGSRTDSGRLAGAYAAGCGGRPEATIIGNGARVSAADAAFANAIAAHSLELDDVDREALFHFGPPVISAALAAGETTQASGKEFLTAVFCGCEMMERLSRAANPSLRNRSFHTTAAAGVFGATVAASKLGKLTEVQMVSALGLAGAQSSGLMEMYGSSMQKRFNPGPAARNGIAAARLAASGFTGAETIFEGERGFLKAFTDKADYKPLRADIGDPYRLEVEFKPYACARPIHPAIDACLSMRTLIYPHLSRIEAIQVLRHPMWAGYHTNAQPTSYHEAQVSLPYSVAVALVEGDAFLDQYEGAESGRADLSGLMAKVTILPVSGFPTTVACKVVLLLSGGDRLERQVDHPKGSVENPMTQGEQKAKFNKLARMVISEDETKSLIELANRIEDLEDIRALTAHMGKVKEA